MPTVKGLPESPSPGLDEIDWAKIDAFSDEDIARQIAEDPDVAPDMADRVSEMRLVLPVAAIRKSLGLSKLILPSYSMSISDA